jgi:hypothetical protein
MSTHEEYKQILQKINPDLVPHDLSEQYKNIKFYLDFLVEEYNRTEYYSMNDLDTIEIPNLTAKMFYMFMLVKVKNKLTFH